MLHSIKLVLEYLFKSLRESYKLINWFQMASFLAFSLPMFNGVSNPIWYIKMEAYLQAYDLLDFDVESLRASASINQI